MNEAPPWPPSEMAELLDLLARAAYRLELSYDETAHIARHAATTIRQLHAEVEHYREQERADVEGAAHRARK